MHYMTFSVLIRLHCLCSPWAADASDGQEKEGCTGQQSALRHCMFNAYIVTASEFMHDFTHLSSFLADAHPVVVVPLCDHPYM